MYFFYSIYFIYLIVIKMLNINYQCSYFAYSGGNYSHRYCSYEEVFLFHIYISEMHYF